MGGKPGRKGGKPIGPDIPIDMCRFPFILSGLPSMGLMPDGGRMKPGPLGGPLEDDGPEPRPMPGFWGLGPGPLGGGPLEADPEEGGGPDGGGLGPPCKPFIAMALLPALGPCKALACAICPPSAETASAAALSAAAVVPGGFLSVLEGGPPVKAMALSESPVRAMAEPVSCLGVPLTLGGGGGGRWVGKGLELWLVLGGPAAAFVRPCIQQLLMLTVRLCETSCRSGSASGDVSSSMCAGCKAAMHAHIITTTNCLMLCRQTHLNDYCLVLVHLVIAGNPDESQEQV